MHVSAEWILVTVVAMRLCDHHSPEEGLLGIVKLRGRRVLGLWLSKSPSGELGRGLFLGRHNRFARARLIIPAEASS